MMHRPDSSRFNSASPRAPVGSETAAAPPGAEGLTPTRAPTITAPLGSTTVTRSVPTDCATATTGHIIIDTHASSFFICLPETPSLSSTAASFRAQAHLAHPAYQSYLPENASGLNAGLTLIVLNVHSSVVLPSTDRDTWCGSSTPSSAR